MAEDQLEPLITECPNCATRFRVTENQLQVAKGRVRCGACLTVFQGIDHLVWESGPGFESAEQAKHALDELLTELGSAAPSASDDPSAAEPSAALDEEPSAALNEEPSAADREPSAVSKDEPSAALNEEPSAALNEEPSAAEPSAALNEEPSAALNEEPSAADREPSAVFNEPESPGEYTPPSESDHETVDEELLESWDAEAARLYFGHEDEEEVDAADDDLSDAEQTHEEQPEVLYLDAAGAVDGAAAAEAGTEPDQGTEPSDGEPSADQQPASPHPDEGDIGEVITFGMPIDQAAPLDADRQEAASEPVDPLGLDGDASTVSFAPEPRRWWVGLVMLVGILVLAGQVFWYQFESWGRDPTLRPVYAFVCDAVGCELPVLRDLKLLETQQLLVRSHPELADALVVDAVIVNEAHFAQPFPELELRFTTIDGTLVAGRRFKPEEYLAGELAGETMMAPRTPVRLALEITDPGGDAVNYFLSFR